MLSRLGEITVITGISENIRRIPVVAHKIIRTPVRVLGSYKWGISQCPLTLSPRKFPLGFWEDMSGSQVALLFTITVGKFVDNCWIRWVSCLPVTIFSYLIVFWTSLNIIYYQCVTLEARIHAGFAGESVQALWQDVDYSLMSRKIFFFQVGIWCCYTYKKVRNAGRLERKLKLFWDQAYSNGVARKSGRETGKLKVGWGRVATEKPAQVEFQRFWTIPGLLAMFPFACCLTLYRTVLWIQRQNIEFIFATWGRGKRTSAELGSVSHFLHNCCG